MRKLIIQEGHFDSIYSYFFDDNDNERVAFLICGKSMASDGAFTLMSREVLFPNDDEYKSASPTNVTWKTTAFLRALGKVEKKSFSVVKIHSHPSNLKSFSDTDNEFEPPLFQVAYNRNGPGVHGSIVFTKDEYIFGRTWTDGTKQEPFDSIQVLGKRFRYFYKDGDVKASGAEFDRQMLAFGEEFQKTMARLHVGVVGCGGTGSAVATFLTRLGVGQITLIDPDKVEKT